MKANRFFTAVCITAMVSIFVFGMALSAYAIKEIDKRAAPDAADAENQADVPGEVSDATGPIGKGSPLHGANAINNAGYKVGDIITSRAFAKLRNWSARTRGYELESLVAIGILSKKDKDGKALRKGSYRVVVAATPEQLAQINEEAKAIVDRKGVEGADLGIDSYTLSARYLGRGNIDVGDTKLQQIRDIVAKVTETSILPAETADTDFQAAITAKKDLPASVAINGEIPFTINGTSLAGVAGVANEIEQQALLAALVDTRIVSPEAKVKGDVYDFSAVPAKVVIYKEDFVADNPRDFETAFRSMNTDQTAVIIVINKSNEQIEAALIKANLLGELGNRIVVMEVAPKSAAADAFGRLFSDKNMYDLRGQTTDQILGNKDLVEGLAGAV